MKDKTKNTSAKKKLVPAVAMLTTSAIMLSSATYAWFTMNKEVEVDGLSMTATTADALEISLGTVDTLKNIGSDLKVQPADTEDEISWTSNICVGQYYEKIGLLRPASTIDGVKIFNATDPTNGGRIATSFVEVSTLAAKVTTKTTLGEHEVAVSTDETEESKGFYVDIPVHLRTSKFDSTAAENPIYCKLEITDHNDGIDETPEGELYKAVRVAFIPTGENAIAASIWGADNEYYNDATGVSASGKAVDSASSRADVTVISGSDLNGSTPIGITIPNASTAGTYGHVDFTVRVWLEGESTSCWDANQNQDWNINFKFALVASELTADDDTFTHFAATDIVSPNRS